MIISRGVSGDVFDFSIAHAYALCSSRRIGARLFILLLCMRNHTIVTIEGRRGSVKRKGKLHAGGVEYSKIQRWMSDFLISPLSTG
ncbi:MAG: hypothetical protein ABSB79_14510 [Syntrophales bacterium]